MAIDLDELFYTNYPADFHIYLVTILNNILDNDHLMPVLLKGVEGINEKAVKKSLKIQLRAMYYQSIETLFELIFALERILNSNVQRSGLWYNLSKSPYRENFKRISKKEFAFLDRNYTIEDVQKNELTVSLAHYIFFFNFKLDPKVIESIKAIKLALKIFARDFSDRDEYNAFKHSIRVFPTLKSVRLTPKQESPSKDILEMKDSISYLKMKDKNSKKVTLISKSLDVIRDYNLALLSSRMISNIICTRRSVKFNRPEFIYFFDCKEIESLAIPSDNLSTIQLNFE